MSKTYSSLPTHTAVYYQITFNFIDKFKNPDYFTLTLDSTSIAGGSSLKTYNSYVTSNICGGSDADTTQFVIAGSMPHTVKTLAFDLKAKVSTGSGAGTLGIRDILLTFVNDSSITTASSCFRVFDSQLLGISGECSCVKGSFSSSGSCTTCNSACQNCFGPSASHCYACASGYSFTGSQCIKCHSSCLTCSGMGEFQCVTCQDGYWLQPNGSCTATCDLPVATRQAVGSLQLCTAACTTSQYILWDGTCVNYCSSPLVSGTSGSNKICSKPCKTGEYLYWNGSCISGCTGTLKSSSSNGVLTCNKPCQTGEYLDWNNNCISGCPTPLVSSSTTSDGILTCNKPCEGGKHLYWNASCISGCLAPLLSSNSNEVDKCDQPCQTGEYLNWNNQCIGSCPSPFVSSVSNNNVALCDKPCGDNEYLYSDGSCLATCPSPKISSNTSGVALCNEACQTNEYLYWNGACNPTCEAPLVSSSTAQGLFCNKPCEHFDYLYEDKSCKAICPDPYLTSNDGEVSLCKKPCNNNEFLDWKDACRTSCSTPLVSSTVKGISVCNKPCDDDEFLDWNKDCIDSCPSPLVSSTSNEVATCKKPCDNNQYLNWENSCQTTCLSPLVSSISNGVNLCKKPCDDDEFLYMDGSCSATCPSPFKKSSSLDVDLCQPPCANSQFLYPDGSCSSKCPTPLVTSTPSDGIKRCSSPCPSLAAYYYSANKTCGSVCSSPSVVQKVEFIQICSVISEPTLSTTDKKSVDQVKSTTDAAGSTASVGVVTSSLLSSQSSGAITLVSLIKMLEYIRYMKINYPPKVEYMMSMQNDESISLTIDVDLPESIEKKFPDYPLPGNFEKYNLVSNFMVNYWEELFTLVIVLLVLAVSMLLALKAKDVKYIGTYSTKLRDIIKWNFFLIIFCGNVDTIGVFSSLEFRTTHFNSFVSVFGTLLCIFVNLIVIYVMFMVPYIIYSLRRARNKVMPFSEHNNDHLKDDSQRFLHCGVLYMNFREKSVLQHSCMFFILLRVYFFNIIIGYFFEYPLVQASLLTTMSVLMLGYFTIARPYKNPLELIKTLTYEAIIAVVNICVLILAIMDYRGIENTENRRKLGDAIISSNVVFNLMAVFYMVVEFVIKVIKVYKLRKTITKTGWRYWLTIIAFLLEPEELELEDDETPVKIHPVAKIQPKSVIKTEEKLPSNLKKRVSFKCKPSSDDQDGQDSSLPIEKVSSIQERMALQSSPMNKVGIGKTTSILSFDGFGDISSKNLLTPANAKTSMLFSQNNLSPRGLLYDLENNSASPSPRVLQRSQLSFSELEHMRLTPRKLDDEKGIFIQRNSSSEVLFNQNKDNRRRIPKRFFGPNSVSLDNSENMSELNLEIGTGNGTDTLHPQQSRFSKYSPEKSKILFEEDP